MERRLVAVLIVAVIAIGVVAAFFALRDGDDGADAGLSAFSTRGRPFEMPVPERLGLPSGPKNTGEAILIAERRRIRIVKLPREDGSSCWGTSERRSDEWQLTNYVCETQFNRFPDPTNPVLVLGRGGFLPGTEFLTFESFQGVAADGVKRVAVIDAQDRLVPMAEVADNAFYGAAPSGRIKAIAALSEDGALIWRSPPRQLPDE